MGILHSFLLPAPDGGEDGEQQQEVACQKDALPCRPCDLGDVQALLEVMRLRVIEVRSCEVRTADDNGHVGEDEKGVHDDHWLLPVEDNGEWSEDGYDQEALPTLSGRLLLLPRFKPGLIVRQIVLVPGYQEAEGTKDLRKRLVR